MYTVYKTTNLINEHIYIGVHKTDNPNDDYLGSGIILKNAIIKYGAENFKKEILFIFDNIADAYAKEKELVNKEFTLREDTYNLTTGGSWSVSYKLKPACGKNHWLFGKHLSEKIKKRMKETLKITNQKPEIILKRSEASKKMWKNQEIKSKIINSIKKSNLHQETRINRSLGSVKAYNTRKENGYIMWNKGKHLSEQDKLNKSIAALNKEKIKCPHCNRKMEPGNAKQWHFDNCKLKGMNDEQKNEFLKPKEPIMIKCTYCDKIMKTSDGNIKRHHFEKCKFKKS